METKEMTMKRLTFDLIQDCDILKVRFLDHCAGGTELLECEAYGRLAYEDKLKIILVSWAANDDDPLDSNWETFVILKSAIRSRKRVGR